MKLYYAPLACSLAPHIILREAGVRFSLERVDTKKKITETGADFLAINPKGYVPVLELDDGEIVTEGIVLQQLIAELNPQAGLTPPRGSHERRKLDQWLVFLATEVHKAHIPLFWPATPADAKPLFIEKIGQVPASVSAVSGSAPSGSDPISSFISIYCVSHSKQRCLAPAVPFSLGTGGN